jgi:hypothetical protein
MEAEARDRIGAGPMRVFLCYLSVGQLGGILRRVEGQPQAQEHLGATKGVDWRPLDPPSARHPPPGSTCRRTPTCEKLRSSRIAVSVAVTLDSRPAGRFEPVGQRAEQCAANLKGEEDPIARPGCTSHPAGAERTLRRLHRWARWCWSSGGAVGKCMQALESPPGGGRGG